MGRLINREKLARAKEQRGLRKRRILEEATSVFARMAYSVVTLDTIGQRAEVERGVASMYFCSKEELFLIVFRECLTEWYDHLDRSFRDAPVGWDRDDLASFLARSMVERPVLTRFLSLLPVVLEQDIEAMEVFRFQRWRCDRMTAVGKLMESQTKVLDEGGGAALLYRVQLVAGGIEIASNPRGAAAFDRDDPNFAPLWVDLESELTAVITGLLGTQQHSNVRTFRRLKR